MTRKEGKGYLTGDFFRQPLADTPNTLELIRAAERAKRVAVGHNASCQCRADTTESLDFGCRCNVDVDYRRYRLCICFWCNNMDGTGFLTAPLCFFGGGSMPD